MSSETDNKNKKPECDCVFNSTGINVFGYMVPWWVIVVVLLLVVYVLYDQGLLDCFVSKPLKTVGIETNVVKPVASALSVETPTEIKRLLEGFRL